jgi:hypothetical protein
MNGVGVIEAHYIKEVSPPQMLGAELTVVPALINLDLC